MGRRETAWGASPDPVALAARLESAAHVRFSRPSEKWDCESQVCWVSSPRPNAPASLIGSSRFSMNLIGRADFWVDSDLRASVLRDAGESD